MKHSSCLLDTNVFLWMIDNQISKFPKKLVEFLNQSNLELFFSAVSSWEIIIKKKLGKLELGFSTQDLPQMLIDMKIKILPVSLAHTLAVEDLPNFHKDPFDRLLIAQCITERLSFITTDKIIKKYPVEVVWG